MLNVWGINTKNGAKELLTSSKVIDNKGWEAYSFTLTPANSDVDYLILEASHDPKAKTPYNGHLLMDNCSPITLLK